MMCEASENEVDVNQHPHVPTESDTDNGKVPLANNTGLTHNQVVSKKSDDSAVEANNDAQHSDETVIGSNTLNVTEKSEIAAGASNEDRTDLESDSVDIEEKVQCSHDTNGKESNEQVDAYNAPPGAVPEVSGSATQRVWNGHSNGTNENKNEHQQKEVMEGQNGSGNIQAKFILTLF